MLKVGKYVYCHNNGFMEISNEQYCTKGRHYKIEYVNFTYGGINSRNYGIIDDKENTNHNFYHYFSIDELLKGECKKFSLGRRVLTERKDEYKV